ncbi:hypothetical protein PhCBS80983_g03924 [Powellomyces hirtus]|uniref:NodB homology domain-containing protein n=1 Tax=Powellomyces hirtus TaxID=109895 RepID=A0A507E0S1_9FUNG|nr:hypothetical protein PhCBS80983_g03924 [Powellomyces hirtus]
MYIKLLTLAALCSPTLAQLAPPSLPLIPPMPAAWPTTKGPNGVIPDAFLADPIVQTALAYVNAVVPAEYLAIPPSTYVAPCTVTYTADPVANCYWPAALCTRNVDTVAMKADVVTCPQPDTWGLTYDDGPSVNVVDGVNVNDTLALRRRLVAANNMKATFFVVGSNALRHPDELVAQKNEGHEIAMHTFTHSPATSLTTPQLVAELKYTEAIVYNATGLIPAMWRPPCGDIDDRVRAVASALGFTAVMWTTTPPRATRDASVREKSPAEAATILENVKTWFTTQPGFISLQHDIDAFTTGIAINILDAITAVGPAFPLKIQPIGTCSGKPVYKNAAGSTSAATSTTTDPASATPSATPTSDASTGSTNGVDAAPDSQKQSNTAATAPVSTSMAAIAVAAIAFAALW